MNNKEFLIIFFFYSNREALDCVSERCLLNTEIKYDIIIYTILFVLPKWFLIIVYLCSSQMISDHCLFVFVLSYCFRCNIFQNESCWLLMNLAQTIFHVRHPLNNGHNYFLHIFHYLWGIFIPLISFILKLFLAFCYCLEPDCISQEYPQILVPCHRNLDQTRS